MTKDYELMVIYSPKLSSEEVERLNETILTQIKDNGGEIIKTDVWGRRYLAYQINKHNEGYYYLNYFKLESTSIKNVKSAFNINEQILRYMVVAKES
ncbi:MAG: 30S ribosomal protein S6 [Candidatus Cloacimonetes bacterium HGW-Cloacimonetes-2]|nr:MAG: 30S ribosomal protein S6 [Candidatus Cloacimonetes bacterium HGW-Cloacimonetes-2]